MFPFPCWDSSTDLPVWGPTGHCSLLWLVSADEHHSCSQAGKLLITPFSDRGCLQPAASSQRRQNLPDISGGIKDGTLGGQLVPKPLFSSESTYSGSDPPCRVALP